MQKKKNTFDECKVFWGFDTKKSIVDFFENEKDLPSWILVFILQVIKKENNYVFL